MDSLRKELSIVYDQTFSYNKEGDPEAFINVLHQVFRNLLDREGLLMFDSLLIERGSLPAVEKLNSSYRTAGLEESKVKKMHTLDQTKVR
jgi:hypothetical protein